ncbi:ATP-binding cassette, subfamily B [Pelosinus fermentans]|uniref:ABC transporter ATP-binding protein n=1 Tax=Pelosinus fermentans TaxID=365349 RepID=UPI000268560F|nr:ABC transporter ATP-binding protein [Pelosinus fermentans]OAM96372.1 Xenobiotic-transporting ATPase [Pelosinus fermentans DSM 17108]SDR39438.1 ATP-binding cassette, subfamily B [Pelosinus fermentans]
MRLLWDCLKPYKLPVFALLLFLIIQSACEVLLPTLVADLINQGIQRADTDFIEKTGMNMLLAAIAAMVCSLASGLISARISTRISADLRQQIFFKVQEFSSNEMDLFGVSSLITRTTNDITRIQTFLLYLLKMGILTPLMMLSGIIMAVFTSGKLSLVLIITLPVMSLVIAWILASMMGYYRSMQAQFDLLNLVLRENLTGIRVIRAFKQTRHEMERFEGVNGEYTRLSIHTQQLIGILMPAVTILMNITTIAVMFFGSRLVMNATMDVGSLVAYVQYITQILLSVMMTSMLFMMYPRLITSLTRIITVLETSSSIVDGSRAEARIHTGIVEFNHVSFTFPQAEEAVLKDVSFTAYPNQMTAIIGSTGSGKSTIAKLLLRFYDVTAGQILIDGVDIRDYTLHNLREKIGYVPQQAVLFSNTIAGNLRFGKKNASREELLKAAGIAQATEFIQAKEAGLDTPIAQGGTNVSGGQKQRLAIARAVIKKPAVYLLDDSFSALDYKTDRAVRQALKSETKDAALIVIAQRISTIIQADRIVVLNEGEVADTGNHEELMKRCGIYQEIFRSQFQQEGLL